MHKVQLKDVRHPQKRSAMKNTQPHVLKTAWKLKFDSILF